MSDSIRSQAEQADLLTRARELERQWRGCDLHEAEILAELMDALAARDPQPSSLAASAGEARTANPTQRAQQGNGLAASQEGDPRLAPEEQEQPIGWVNGRLHCYGGCGLPYTDFPCDALLPNDLWNRIAVGAPFGEPHPSDEREGRGGVLCPMCIAKRLAALPECTAIEIKLRLDPQIPPETDATSLASETPANRARLHISRRDSVADEAVASVSPLQIGDPRPAPQELLKRLIMAWDSDDSLEFLAACRTARRTLGLKLADEREEADDTGVLIANGYTEDGIVADPPARPRR